MNSESKSEEDKNNEKLRVLFLCNGNSCRSQMAEGWCEFYHSNFISAVSAGILPERGNPGKINENAIKVMKEMGINIENNKSKNIQDFIDQNDRIDAILTVCDSQCPAFPAEANYSPMIFHHSFDDPPSLTELIEDYEQKISEYRRVCKEIQIFIRDEFPELLKKKIKL